jgi:DNA-binding NarL/FixJ family response regulator
MPSKRILIVNVRSLLMESVAGLLESNENGSFDIVSTLADNLPDLLQEIEELKPEIIVLDEAASYVPPPELIISVLNIQKIRLIVLDSRTNKMDIYDKSKFMLSHPNHFTDALHLCLLICSGAIFQLGGVM